MDLVKSKAPCVASNQARLNVIDFTAKFVILMSRRTDQIMEKRLNTVPDRIQKYCCNKLKNIIIEIKGTSN